MPDLKWNQVTWNEHYSWQVGGEEWSAKWGSSQAQWFGVILPRLHTFLPCDAILEIAPGYGRWTRFLLAHARKRYVGIDLSAKCVAACRQRFARAKKATFHANDGRDLGAARPGAFDLVFSFDSLVHANQDVLAAYLQQVLALLSDRGVAWIHHSNVAAVYAQPQFRERRFTDRERHWRDEGVSANWVKDLVESSGGDCLVQEVFNWGDSEGLIDCVSLFRRRRTREPVATRRLDNPEFMDAANLVRKYIQPYCELPSGTDDS